jgi:DNA-binding transcriptional regulator YdaS (Cro superfamily)
MGFNAEMQLNAYLEGSRGRAAALARAIGVRPTQIGKWVSGERPIPEKRCVQIERATAGQVSRQELRDDWSEIWPELRPVAHGADERGDQVVAGT